MAAVAITYTFVDQKGKTRINKIHVPTGFSPAQYAEFALAFGDLITVLSDGMITDIGVSIPLSLSGATLRSAAESFADIAKKAFFFATSGVTGLFAKFFIPTFDNGNSDFVPLGSDQMDLADPLIGAVVDIIENGVTVSAVPIEVVDLRGNALDEVIKANANFRKFN